jgi:hypothetical protein
MATPKKSAASKAPAAPAVKKLDEPKPDELKAGESKADESNPDESKADGAGNADQDNKPPVINMVKALSVQSRREGFRRAGHPWSKQETVVLLSELSKEQIDLIKGEAVLAVTEVEVPAQEAAE